MHRQLYIDVPAQVAGTGGAPSFISFADSFSPNKTPCKIVLQNELAGKRLRLKTYRYALTSGSDDITARYPCFYLELKMNNSQSQSHNITYMRSYANDGATTSTASTLIALPFSSSTSLQESNWGIFQCPNTGTTSMEFRFFIQPMGVHITYDDASFAYIAFWFDILD